MPWSTLWMRNSIEELRFSFGGEIVPAVADPSRIHELIDQYYSGGSQATDGGAAADAAAELAREAATLTGDDAEEEASAAPIIRYVDLVMYQAIKRAGLGHSLRALRG